MKTRCEWCGTEDVNTKLSDDGDNCCSDCINDANDNAKPIKSNGDIEYLSKNELMDLVYNMSVWDGHYNKDDLNEMIMQYRRNK